MYERQLLRELEALRTDVDNADKKVVQAAPAPKPTVIPPLEDFSRLPPAQEAHGRPQQHFVPRQNGAFGQPPLVPTSASPNNVDPLGSTSAHAVGPSQQQQPPRLGTVSPNPTFLRHEPPLSAPATRSFTPSSIQSGPSSAGPSSPRAPHPPTSVQSTAPSSPTASQGPPLGGRLVDGSKSMFVKSATPQMSSPLHGPSYPASPSSQSAGGDPLMGSPALGSANGLSQSTSNIVGGRAPAEGLDPLGHARPGHMSQSVRVQPTRPRLDAREAASKLANMF